MAQSSVGIALADADTTLTPFRSDFRIFISYRRSDSSEAARGLRDDLVRAGYSGSNVFFDVSQDYGESFPDLIEDGLRLCDVLLVVIGPTWATVTDQEGRRRLDNPQDWTRREIETALERGIPVIPVRVAGARMPRHETLPPSIAEVTTRQAADQADQDWWERLLERLDGIRLERTTRRVLRIRARNHGFVGQEQTIEAIGHALASGGGSASTVALTGLPGHGKTQLAVEFAHRHSAEYRIIWEIPADDPSVATQRLADLAEELRLPRRKSEDYADVARRELERSGDWLLIFDNAKDPESIVDLLPKGGGHTVITSQRLGWDEIGATTIPVEAMTVPDAVELLRPRESESAGDLEQLAEDLMRIPWALQQASSYMKRKHISASEYLQELEAYSAFGEGPGSDSPSMFGAWRLCFDEISAAASREAPGAVELLSLLSFLAADDIPLGILRPHSAALPPPIAQIFHETRRLRDALALLADFSQVRRTAGRVSAEQVSLHRTVQYFTRSLLDPEDTEKWVAACLDLLLAAFPEDPEEIGTWKTSDSLLNQVSAALEHSVAHPALGLKHARLLDRVGVFHRTQARLQQARHAFDDASRMLAGREGHEERALLATIRRHLGGVERDRGDFAAARRSYDEALTEHEKTLGSESVEASEDHYSLGSLFVDLEDWTSARSSLDAALRIRRGNRKPHHRIAECLSSLFVVELRTGNVLQAKQRLDDAAAAYEELGLQELPEARILTYLDAQLFGSGVANESTYEQFLKVIESAEDIYGKSHPELAEWLLILGDNRLEERDPEKADEYYHRALDIDESAYGEGHWKVGRDLLRVFLLDSLRAREDQAREHLIRAIRILRTVKLAGETNGESNEISLFALAKFDDALASLAPQPVAIEPFKRIVDIVSTTWGEGSTLHASALEYLGGELQEHRSAQGHEQATRILEDAVVEFKKALGDRHVRVARCLCRLGAVQLELSELEAADRAFEEAREIIEGTDTPNSFELLTALIGQFRLELQRSSTVPETSEPLARIRELAESSIGVLALLKAAGNLAADRHFEIAIELLQQTAEIRIEKHGRAHAEVADTWAQIGLLHYKRGDFASALEFFDRSLRTNRALHGPEHQSVVTDLSNRAYSLARLGRIDEAVRAQETSLDTDGRLRGETASTLSAVHARSWLSLAEAPTDREAQRMIYEAGLARMRPERLAARFLARLGALAAVRGDEREAATQLTASVRVFASEGSEAPFWSTVREASTVAGAEPERDRLSKALAIIAKESRMSEQLHRFTPALSGVVPEDWLHKESVTFLSPDGQANVIASSEPLDPSIDTDRYAEVQGDLLRNEFPGYDEKQFEPLEVFEGLPGLIRTFEWSPPDGTPVTQMQVYAVLDGRGYTATATTPSSAYPDHEIELRLILSGLTLNQHVDG